MEINKEISDKVIIALDFPTSAMALDLVDELGDLGSFYKVGLELFLNSGGQIIEALKHKNKKIFLDLKFHDIPNTVSAAVRWASQLDVDIVNVHALGGMKMMEEAKRSFNSNSQQKLIAVTILTSMSDNDLQEIGFNEAPFQMVKHLANLAHQANLDGVVCSAHEASTIKKSFGDDFVTVCPGIRPLWAVAGDQNRIMTPKEAIKSGVDHMVIGRPITGSKVPKEALKTIFAEIREGLDND